MLSAHIVEIIITFAQPDGALCYFQQMNRITFILVFRKLNAIVIIQEY